MNKKVRAWILYDWANSAFALTTMAAFFPILFKQYWSIDTPMMTTLRLGIGNSIAGLIVALASPILAELVVVGDRRQKGLFVATLLGVIANGALFFIPQGGWYWALVLFITARIGFQVASLFYDTLLSEVADTHHRHKISSLGYAVGYLGCGILFVVNMVMVSKPELFGFKNSLEGARYSILSVSLWWLLFSLPLFVTPLTKREEKHSPVSFRAFWTRFMNNLSFVMKNKVILYFLIGYWFYIDGVHTLILMASNFGMNLGLSVSTLMTALLVVQLTAFPSAWILGNLAEKIGAKIIIIGTIIVYVFVAILSATALVSPLHFIVFAGITGLAQGAIQALSRSLFSLIIPEDRSTELFGLYNTVGRFAVIIGPAFVSLVTFVGSYGGLANQQSQRLGMGSLSILFLAGLWFLMKVSVESEQKK